MVAATDETIAKLRAASNAPVDLREAMQRMTLEIAGRTMFSFGMDRHGAALARLRDGVWRTAGAAAFPRHGVAAGLAEPAGFSARPLPQAMDAIRRHADGGAPRRRQERGRAAERSVRPDGRRARSRDRRGLHRRTARRSGGDHDSRRPRDHRHGACSGRCICWRSIPATQEQVGRRGEGRDRRRRSSISSG